MTELLRLARSSPRSKKARWRFVEHEKIERILDREIGRFRGNEAERDELRREAVVRIVEELARPDLTYRDEARLVAYWNRRIKSLVASGVVACFPLGRRLDRAREVKEFLTGDHKLLGKLTERRQRAELERRRLLDLGRAFLFAYPDRKTANVAWYRAQGLSWSQIGRKLGLTAREAKERHHRFVAAARSYFVEEGEMVATRTLGLHAGEDFVAGAVVEGRAIVETWTLEIEGPADLEAIATRIVEAFDDGATHVATSLLPHTEAGALVRYVLFGRGIGWEEFDASALAAGVRPGRVPERLPVGEQFAALVGVAKETELRLKKERYS